MENREVKWVREARTGDAAAFSKLVEAYQTPVYNLAYRMLGNAAEAEDAAQETFIRAYTRLNTYDPDRKFSSWLLAIASHYCIDVLRRRRIQTLRQSFNMREGIRASDIKLPGRLSGKPPLNDGPLSGVTIDVDTMQQEYFQSMGWDPDSGKPKPETLEELGLSSLITN